MWFKKAAGGWRRSVATPTRIRLRGRRLGCGGGVINFKTARTYFQYAAEGGDHDAQRRLGWAYMDGDSEDEEEDEEEEDDEEEDCEWE